MFNFFCGFLFLLFVLLICILPYFHFYFKERLRAKAWQKQFDKNRKKMI